MSELESFRRSKAVKWNPDMQSQSGIDRGERRACAHEKPDGTWVVLMNDLESEADSVTLVCNSKQEAEAAIDLFLEVPNV